jgi:hypothetical protein
VLILLSYKKLSIEKAEREVLFFEKNPKKTPLSKNLTSVISIQLLITFKQSKNERYYRR